MKNILIVLFISFTIPVASNACEICGCSANGYHLGILPQFGKNFIGLRYGLQRYHSQHLLSEQLMIPGGSSSELYQSLDLWGRFYAGKKLQIFGFVPYRYFEQTEENKTATRSGIADVTVAAQYLLVNTGASTKKFKQTFSVGGGVKLPTGSFKIPEGSEISAGMNTGSGSTDFILNSIYTARYGRAGINLDASYKLNTKNKQSFQYGNTITTGARAFFWQNIGKKISLLPNIGVLFEQTAKDRHYAEKQKFSGGSVTSLVAGTDVYISRFVIGASYYKPLQSNLSEGLVTQQSRMTASISVIF